MSLKIELVIPSLHCGSNTSHMVTAERWEKMLSGFGYSVRLTTGKHPISGDVVFLFEPGNSFRPWDHRPSDRRRYPLIVVLDGCDLQRLEREDARILAAAEAADRLIVSQQSCAKALPSHLHSKTVVVQPSHPAPVAIPSQSKSINCVSVLSDMDRGDTVLSVADAATRLDNASRVRVVHAGAARHATLNKAAKELMLESERYCWVGSLPHHSAVGQLSRSWMLVIPTTRQGGGNAMTEAIAHGIPILAARSGAAEDCLGETYPGFFDEGDAEAIMAQISRAENDVRFYRSLRSVADKRLVDVSPERERNDLKTFIGSLG